MEMPDPVQFPLGSMEEVEDFEDQLKDPANSQLKQSVVAAKALETAVFGVYYNVSINLKDITDDAFKMATQTRASVLLQEAKENAAAVLHAAEERN